MKKAIIFDMDGTLADTLPLCITAFRKSIETLSHRKLTDQDIIDTFGPSEEGTIAALIPENYDKGVELYLHYYKKLHPHMCPAPFPGIPELISMIKKRKLKTALVTGKGQKSLDITLENLNMQDWFDYIAAGSPKGPNKTEGLQKIFQHFDMQAREALYIGDTISDINACREVGVPIVSAAWAKTANKNALEKHHPDYLCYTVKELYKLIERV